MGYGQVAKRAGLGRAARMVGRALREAPDGLELPWHRVVRADGSIAFPTGSRLRAEQVRRLRREGVEVKSGRVRMPRVRDEADLDRLLWGEP